MHEVAQRANPHARVVYVDSDAVAIAHATTLLADNPLVVAIHADARNPEYILAHPQVRELLDFSRPLAVLLLSVLQFLPDDAEAFGVVRVLRDALAGGSYLAISHTTYAGLAPEVVAKLEGMYARSSNPSKARERNSIAQFFEGLELVPPGVVAIPLWHPEGPDDLYLDTPEQSSFFAGVGRKLETNSAV